MSGNPIHVLSSAGTVAIGVGSTTHITEVLTAAAVDVIAAFVLLHVELALGALLPLLVGDHLQQLGLVRLY